MAMQAKARVRTARARAFAHPTGGSVGCAKHPDRRFAPSGHRLRVRTASIALRRSAACSVNRPWFKTRDYRRARNKKPGLYVRSWGLIPPPHGELATSVADPLRMRSPDERSD